MRHMQHTVNTLVRGTTRQGFNSWRHSHHLSLVEAEKVRVGYSQQGLRLLGSIMASWTGDVVRLCVVQWRAELRIEQGRGFILDRMSNVMNMNMIITIILRIILNVLWWANIRSYLLRGRK